MPITLSCPTCGKRFRARDESAGKRVKCPYCQAAIVVSADGSAAEPPADPGPIAPPRFPPAAPARPPAAVTPGDWGDEPPPGGPKSAPLPPPPAIPAPAPVRGYGLAGAPPKPAPKPTGKLPSAKPAKPAASGEAKTPNQLTLPAWKKTKAGLFWVLFGLFFLALPGFVEFGKLVYERSVGELPSGEGWVKIDGAVNSGVNTIILTKRQEIDVAAYGAPMLLGALCLTLGRLAAGAAPKASGAKGMFAFSGVLTLLGFASVAVATVTRQVEMFEVARYTALGAIVALVLAELWFLTGLAATGTHLKRPAVARSVGFFWFVLALAVVAATVGWEQYTKELRPKPAANFVDVHPSVSVKLGNLPVHESPKTHAGDKDTELYEAAAKMLGWLVLVGCYWRVVRATRAAIREQIDATEE